MTFTTTPVGARKLELEMKVYRETFVDAPLPTVEELCAPLATSMDRISDYAYFKDSLGWLYDFGRRDEVRPRIKEIRDLLAAVVDQSGYIVRGCVRGDTLNLAGVLSSAMRMVVEEVSGAIVVRDQMQALDDSECCRSGAERAPNERGPTNTHDDAARRAWREMGGS